MLIFITNTFSITQPIKNAINNAIGIMTIIQNAYSLSSLTTATTYIVTTHIVAFLTLIALHSGLFLFTIRHLIPPSQYSCMHNP